MPMPSDPTNNKARVDCATRASNIHRTSLDTTINASMYYMPPSTDFGVYDSFLHQEDHPEPCSLTPEEFQYPDRSERRSRRLRPNHVSTDEPRRWVDVLFEPGDVLEFRIIPPRSVIEAMRPRIFMAKQTAIQHGIYCWAFADEVEVLINTLADLNCGNATWWGVLNSIHNKWTDVEGEAGIPLNVYASANPRMVTGLSKNEDVILARSLFVDLDKTTLEAAMQKLATSRLPLPTMIVNSGHGVHFYWRLLEAITDLEYWTALQKRLIQLLGSDPAIHDPSRPMRIPGFMNVNGETPTPCYIHDADAGRRYSLADILPHLPRSRRSPKDRIFPTSNRRISTQELSASKAKPQIFAAVRKHILIVSSRSSKPQFNGIQTGCCSG